MADHIPTGAGHEHDGHLRLTYNDVHNIIGATAKRIKQEYDPDLFIAIGGGGFIPARILRTFLKQQQQDGKKRNIPIQAIGLSLYEEVATYGPDVDTGLSQAEKLGKEVQRVQWLDFSTLGNKPLLGRKILIVDEVDDSRTTLGYAVSELQKDIQAQLDALPEAERNSFAPTELAIFVVQNKLKTKLATLPDNVKYFAGQEIEDRWVDYPWEQQDILLHDEIAAKQTALGL